MSAAPSLTEQLQSDIVARISGASFFANVRVIQESEGTTIVELQKSLETVSATGSYKPGLGILVHIPTRKVVYQASFANYLYLVQIDVIERPKINRAPSNLGTGITFSAASEALDDLLWQWDLGGRCAETDLVKPFNDGDGNVGVEHFVEWTAGRKRTPQCVAPSISIATGNPDTVTLTNNEAGATLYYTTDTSFPWSGNSAAQIYATPFTATSGTIIRAAAYSSTKNGSDVPEKTAP